MKRNGEISGKKINELYYRSRLSAAVEMTNYVNKFRD